MTSLTRRAAPHGAMLRCTPIRVGLAGLAAAVALAAAPASALAAGSWGYVWADQPTTASYTPSTLYQASSAHRTNTIVRNGVGDYVVTFPGLGRTGKGGTVNVTAYGGASEYCGVGGWSAASTGGTVTVGVLCTDANGNPVDALFDATYAVPVRSGGPLAYVWADQPSAAAYTPDPFYQFNSTGRRNTITRFGTGSYQVHLPGLGAYAGTVKVTAYGASRDRCKVGGWGPSGTTQLITVYCFDAAGNPVDSYFTLTYANHRSPLGAARPYGYAWGNQPTTASYAPDSFYARSQPSGPISISRLAAGVYAVTFASVGTAEKSDVQVTAYGSDSSECGTNGWTADGGGQTVYVSCRDTSGDLTDTYYTVQWFR